MTKGIILAGGSGTRLHPITKTISKQILPVYDKPLIYYPLSTLMLAGIKEILIITSKEHKELFENLLDDGSKLGLKIEYSIQAKPNGIPEAFIIGEKFIGQNNVCLILGDNIFYSDTFVNKYILPTLKRKKPTIFAYQVADPERYGVVELYKKNIISIQEKPKFPKSNYAITGLYFFNKDVVKISKSLKPSKRNELEIVDILNFYLKKKKLKVELLGRGVSWLDTGTPKSLIDASNYFEVLESRQGLKVGCIEEIAYINKYISKKQFIKLAKKIKNSDYGKYLIRNFNKKF